jgi:predicted helicase
MENIVEDTKIVSNDNHQYFGDVIDKKTLLWAINENIICDYTIQTIVTSDEKIEQYLKQGDDRRLLASAYASLKTIYDQHSHHLLIYSNNKDNSEKLIKYIQLLLDDGYFDIPGLYYSNYHSEMKSNYQKQILNNFEKSKFGIITCVYCLGEGWDFPKLDAVVFAENMSSNIRIVQSALRASRKDKNQPNKITKIILPILNKINWLDDNDNSDLKKIRQVIYQMGLEDETIMQKMKVFNIEIKKNDKETKENKSTLDIDLMEYDEELTEKLKLKTMKRSILGTSYEKAKKIIAMNNIKTRKEYYELCKIDNRLTDEPDVMYKGQFSWIDYLNIEKIYYDLETCKNKVNDYLSIYPEIKQNYMDLSIICDKLCKIDKLFPPNGLWVEYYNIKDLKDIIIITTIGKKKKIGAIL